MGRDLITDLKDVWFKEAAEVDAHYPGKRWKPRYNCMKQIFDVLTGKQETNVEVTVDITDNVKAMDFMKIMVMWLCKENHLFTRIAILRLMPKLIDAFDKKLIQCFESKLIESILTKQWMDKKAQLLTLVTPVLLKLWAKTGFELNSEDFKDRYLLALRHRGKEAREESADFLGKLCIISEKSTARKRQLLDLCGDRELGLILGKMALIAKEKPVKLAACRALHGLKEMGMIGHKWVDKELTAAYEKLADDRRGKKNLAEAVKIYDKQKGPSNELMGAEAVEEEKEDKPWAINISYIQRLRQQLYKEEQRRQLDKPALHIWNAQNAYWMPLKKALATDSQKKSSSKAKVTSISAKFGGLVPAEILMYNAVVDASQTLWSIAIPHELMMAIMVFSQGFKFEKGDECIFFRSGIFSDTERGTVKAVIEDTQNRAAPKYLMSPIRGGSALRTPFNHVFSENIVIIDEEKFRAAHSDYAELKRGDVLTINSMRVETVMKYSKKKKRKIRKMALMLQCRRRRGRLRLLKWNASVFAQAKWKMPLQ